MCMRLGFMSECGRQSVHGFDFVCASIYCMNICVGGCLYVVQGASEKRKVQKMLSASLECVHLSLHA